LFSQSFGAMSFPFQQRKRSFETMADGNAMSDEEVGSNAKRFRYTLPSSLQNELSATYARLRVSDRSSSYLQPVHNKDNSILNTDNGNGSTIREDTSMVNDTNYGMRNNHNNMYPDGESPMQSQPIGISSSSPPRQLTVRFLNDPSLFGSRSGVTRSFHHEPPQLEYQNLVAHQGEYGQINTLLRELHLNRRSRSTTPNPPLL